MSVSLKQPLVQVAYEDGFRPAKFPLCPWLCHFCHPLVDFHSARNFTFRFAPAGIWQHSFATLMYFLGHTEILLLKELSLAHSYLQFLVWFFNRVTNIYFILIIC